MTIFFSVCEAIGVQNRYKVPDSRMTASSSFAGHFDASRGRLWNQRQGGSWEPKYPANVGKDWLQVDMGSMLSVCAVATQGNGWIYPDWVTAYKIKLSTDGNIWKFYQEDGVDKVSIYSNCLGCKVGFSNRCSAVFLQFSSMCNLKEI